MRSAVIAVCMAAMVFLAGCGGDGQVTTVEIKVGAVLALDGQHSVYGTSIRNGMEIALDEINKEVVTGGNPFTIDIKNSNSTVQGTTSAMNELVAAGCKIVIGAETTDLTAELIPIAAEEGIILITPSATSPSLGRIKSKDYFFRLCPTDDNEAEKIAEDLPRAHSRFPFIKRPIFRVLTLVQRNSAYTDGLWDAFGGLLYQNEQIRENYEHLLFDLEQLQSEPGESGWNEQMRTVLDKAREYQIDDQDPQNSGAVVIFGFAEEVTKLLGAMKHEGLKLQVYASSAVDTADFLKVAPELAEGLVFPRVFDPHDTKEPKVVKFVGAYKAKFGIEPDLYAAYGYDAAMLIGLTLQQKDVEEYIQDPRNFRLMMNDVRFSGLTGRVDFSQQNNEVIKNFLLFKIVEGQPVFLDDYENKLEMEKYRELRELRNTRGASR